MRPVCVPCRRFFSPKKNGFYFIEGQPRENGAERGLEAPEKWMPYKLWCGDLWQCEGCGAEIISGVGRDRVAEHYESDFSDMVKRTGAEIQINDC